MEVKTENREETETWCPLTSHLNIIAVSFTSLSLLATTLPADPPPTTMKSYSLSGNAFGKGRPHGSSMSHCDLINTSNKPMNNMNADPPHVLANVGPGWVTGQLQLLLISVVILEPEITWDCKFLENIFNPCLSLQHCDKLPFSVTYQQNIIFIFFFLKTKKTRIRTRVRSVTCSSQ